MPDSEELSGGTASKTHAPRGARAGGILGNAVPYVLIVILVTEGILGWALPSRCYCHDVDRLVYNMSNDTHNPAIILVGDSVGNQLFRRLNRKRDDFALLTSNQAIEMPGHYFLVRRHLEGRERPQAVVFCGRYPFERNLEQVFTENYVQRCFTRWKEIVELTAARRDPVFGAKMVAYRLFPSYKYRMQVQERLVGTSAGSAYFGSGRSKKSRSQQSRPQGLFDLLNKRLTRDRDISKTFFFRLVAMLDRRGIDFYYVPAPMPAEEHKGSREEEAGPFLESVGRLFPRFHYRGDLLVTEEKKRFSDGVHLDEKGLKQARQVTDPFLQEIMSERSSP